MKSFFKPTKVTWITFCVLAGIFISAHLYILLGKYVESLAVLEILDIFVVYSLVIIVVTVWLPVGVLFHAGFPVGEDASEGILAFPNIAGWVIVIILNVIIYLFIASIVSQIWYRVKNKGKSQKEKEKVEF